MLGCVDSEFMEHERKGLDDRPIHSDIRPGKKSAGGRERRHLLTNKLLNRNACPSSFSKQGMGTGERLHPMLNSGGIKGRVIGVAQADDAVDDRQDVVGSVVDFHQQAMLGGLQCLDPPVLRHVDLRAKEIQDPSVIPMDGT